MIEAANATATGRRAMRGVRFTRAAAVATAAIAMITVRTGAATSAGIAPAA